MFQFSVETKSVNNVINNIFLTGGKVMSKTYLS